MSLSNPARAHEVPSSAEPRRASGLHFVSRDLTIDVSREQGDMQGEMDVIVVTPAGEIDIANVEILDRALRMVAAVKPHRVRVDAAGLVFVDSTGVATLAKRARSIAEQGGRFVVTSAPPILARLIRALELDDLLPADDGARSLTGATP